MTSDTPRPLTDPADLVPLEEYRRDVLARIVPLEPIELALLDAHGCVLAEDVIADADVPAFANSAMDGYAVVASAISPDTPIRVAGEVAAGSGEAVAVDEESVVRIMTGAPLPDGADSVIPVELATEEDDTVRFSRGASPGDHVRPAGGDVRGGTQVLAAGRRLGAADLGILAAIGHDRVRVHPKPRVTVISTGDELVEPERALEPGQIHDSNSFMLTAMAREAGAIAYRSAVVPDNRRALAEAFVGALTNADVLVTSGGVSAGRYDLVKDVLSQLGDVSFNKVAMQPGMPQAFGFLNPQGPNRIPCFGLPGNPVSSFVSFELFVRPALRRLQGRHDLNRPRVSAVLQHEVNSPPHKVSFLRVKLHRDGAQWVASLTGPQGSGLLHSAVDADGLAEIPADRTSVPAGETVVVHLLVAPQ